VTRAAPSESDSLIRHAAQIKDAALHYAVEGFVWQSQGHNHQKKLE
jgi:hypothetical protein